MADILEYPRVFAGGYSGVITVRYTTGIRQHSRISGVSPSRESIEA